MGARPFDRLRVTDVSCAVIVLGMVGISGLDGSLLWRTLRVVALCSSARSRPPSAPPSGSRTSPPPVCRLRDAVAQAAPRPVLLIAAGTVADEQHADAAIRAASPSSVVLWVVPGARHIGGLHADPAEWERRVVAFLDTNLQ